MVNPNDSLDMCEQCGVIYECGCEVCGKVNVGETERSLGERVNILARFVHRRKLLLQLIR